MMRLSRIAQFMRVDRSFIHLVVHFDYDYKIATSSLDYSVALSSGSDKACDRFQTHDDAGRPPRFYPRGFAKNGT